MWRSHVVPMSMCILWAVYILVYYFGLVLLCLLYFLHSWEFELSLACALSALLSVSNFYISGQYRFSLLYTGISRIPPPGTNSPLNSIKLHEMSSNGWFVWSRSVIYSLGNWKLETVGKHCISQHFLHRLSYPDVHQNVMASLLTHAASFCQVWW